MNREQVETRVKGIEVDVRASLKANGEVHYETIWRNASDPNGVWRCEPIDLPNGPNHYKLEFNLDDKSGRKLQFYSDPAEAMYVRVGGCPSGPGNGDEQILFEDVDRSKKKLTIKDFNQDPPRDLHYMLRFDGERRGSHPPYEHDPVIINGGGGV